TSRSDFGWTSQHWQNDIRGRLYLRARRGPEAAAEFEKIIEPLGVTLAGWLTPLSYSLSHLYLARARAMSGNVNGAKTAYNNFLILWKNADPDVPVLKQAKAE